MIRIISPFNKKQLDILSTYREFLKIQIDKLPNNIKTLTCLSNSYNQPSKELLEWEFRNRNLQNIFFKEFDITEILKGGVNNYIQNLFSEPIMISQQVYLRIETPCGKRKIFMPHKDNIGIPSCTLWIPLVDITVQTGGICLENSNININCPGSLLIDNYNHESIELFQPYIPFGKCMIFSPQLLHCGTTAMSNVRLSIDLRFSPKSNALDYNKLLLGETYRINPRNYYEAINFSILDSFRLDQKEHLNLNQDFKLSTN